MTAFDFIDQLYSRAQFGARSALAGNVRTLTRPQLDLLVALIGENEEGGAVEHGLGGSFVWMPRGRHKYVITEDPSGHRHTIARLSNLSASSSGMLF